MSLDGGDITQVLQAVKDMIKKDLKITVNLSDTYATKLYVEVSLEFDGETFHKTYETVWLENE